MQTKRAYLYVRVSTDEQTLGYSQRSQEELLRRYCEIQNIDVKEVFFEDHSAKSFDRPQFKKMLMLMRKQKSMASLLLFVKWDRFSRNAGDAYGMINTLNKLGVEPVAIEQPLDLSVPENKMMLAFYLAAPEVENMRRASNVFSGMRRAQKEGRWMGIAPIGYTNIISPEGRKSIVLHKTNAPLMAWVFKEIANGKFTTEEILKRAREKGLKTSKNNFWSAIRNPVYCGKIRIKAFKTEPEALVTGQHMPLITEALFYEVQDVLDGKKKQQRTKMIADSRFPLRGFVICAQCNKLLTASSSKGRKIYYSYYHCLSSCGVRFKAEIINEEFVSLIKQWKPHAAVAALYSHILEDIYTGGRKVTQQEQKEIKNELHRLRERQQRARELLMSDSLEADDYKQIKKECDQAIIRLEQKWIDNNQQQADIAPLMAKAVQLLSNLDEVYAAATTENKRNIIGSISPTNSRLTESIIEPPE